MAGIADSTFGGLTYTEMMAKLPEQVELEMYRFGQGIELGLTPTVEQWPILFSKLDYICEFYCSQVFWDNVTFNSLKKTYPRIEKGTSSLSISKVKVNATSTGFGSKPLQPKPSCFICGEAHFWVY